MNGWESIVELSVTKKDAGMFLFGAARFTFLFFYFNNMSRLAA